MTDQNIPTPPDVLAPKLPPAGKFEKVLFKGEIEIHPDKPLPHLDRGQVKAYAAGDKQGLSFYALVCEKHLVPQVDMVQKYMSLSSPHLPKLLGFGTLNWPVDKKDHAVFIYENKMGQCLTAGLNPNCLGLKPEMVLNTIFRNLVEVMQSMRDTNFFHGSICPSNLYKGSSDNFENVMLGEMLSAPPGYTQPALFETIERAVASPIGRGVGSLSDDLYSFGVTLAVLMRNHDPLEGFSSEDIILKKIEISSFNAIVGQDRFPGPILELLRGLLNDVASQRWTFDDVLTWIDGRRVNAKHDVITISKASRPIDFARKKFLRPQPLAMELTKDAAAAALIIENNEISLWLNRSIQNKEFEDKYENAVERIKNEQRGGNYVERLASNVAIALASGYPLMYKGLNFFPAGFGNLLVDAVVTKKNITPFVEAIQSGMVAFWSICNSDVNFYSADSVNRLGTCQAILRQSSVGYGIERCIYYLSPSTPCLSEKLENFCVRTPEDYVRALETMSTLSNRPEWFLDRHITAFLCARDKSIIEPHLADLNATENHRQRQAVLRILMAIQMREKMEPLPGLSAWIVGMLGCVIDRYHDREERERIRVRLDKIKSKGNLRDIVETLGDFNKIQADMKGFAFAMRQYQALKAEFEQLKYALDTNKNFGMEEGRQTAMMVSGIIAAAVVGIYLFFTLLRG